MARSISILLMVLLAVLPACDFGGDDEATPEPTRPSSSTTTTAPPAGTASTTVTSVWRGAVDPDRAFSTEGVFVRGAEFGGRFTQIRFGSGDAYVRVVFEFEERLPHTFFVEYDRTPEIIGDGGCYASAADRAAGANLVVSFYPTATSEDPSSESARKSYAGEDRIRPRSAEEIVEALLFCEFEATVEWVLIVREVQPFRVTTLADPPRLVVDVPRH